MFEIEELCQTFPGASLDDIQSAEEHYNIVLPDIYKALLSTTNGIVLFDNNRFVDVDRIIWFKDLVPEIRDDAEAMDSDCPDEDYYYDRNMEIIDANGYKQAYPPQDRLFFAHDGIVDMDGNKISNPPKNIIIRDPYVHRCMLNGGLVLRYKRYLNDLLMIGHGYSKLTYYCINPKVAIQTGEYEIYEMCWKAMPDFCSIRFLTFIELMELLLKRFIQSVEEG